MEEEEEKDEKVAMETLECRCDGVYEDKKRERKSGRDIEIQRGGERERGGGE